MAEAAGPPRGGEAEPGPASEAVGRGGRREEGEREEAGGGQPRQRRRRDGGVAAPRLGRLTLGEASGALGDLGTFLPLVTGLAAATGLDAGTTLLGTGLYNVATGAAFGLPMPVQPMKAIAAIALAEGLPPPAVMCGGMFVSAAVLLLGATGLVDALDRLTPRPVIRGMQVGLGLKLAAKGWGMVWVGPSSPAAGGGGWLGTEGKLCSLVVGLYVAATVLCSFDAGASGGGAGGAGAKRARQALARQPAALVVVLLGVALALATTPGIVDALRWGPSPVAVVSFSKADVVTGLWRAALPQLPLTALNSVVAVCQLSRDLAGPAGGRVARPRPVAVSVGVMNLVGAPFGVLPCCHGAGGLAAQHRFGARTGTAVVFLGLVKVALSLCFGSSITALLDKFPKNLLGLLLAFSGVELASVSRKLGGEEIDTFFMLLTASLTLGTGSTALGFGGGMLAVGLAWALERASRPRARPAGRPAPGNAGEQEEEEEEMVGLLVDSRAG